MHTTIQKGLTMLSGFKKFIARGNVIDMAVGVVMGSAVTSVVNSLVTNLINPLVAMIFGQPDLSNILSLEFNGATISFGAIFTDLINFLIIACAVYFCIVLPINKMRDFSAARFKKNAAYAESDSAESEAVPTDIQMLELLQEIRDELKDHSFIH